MKKILLIALSFALITSLAACAVNDFEAYMTSLDKTTNIVRGQQSMNFGMDIDFDTTGLTTDEIKELNYIKNFHSEFNLTYDDEVKKIIARNYLNFGGLGFDTVLYDDGEKTFIKMPVVGKYLVLDEDFLQRYIDDANNGEQYISNKSIEEIQKKWVDAINRDDVFSGKESIMSTPDGDVKVTEYTIKLTGEEFKNIINESANILASDEILRNTIESYIEKRADDKINIEYHKILKNFKQAMEEGEIKDLKYIAYIDIDGYIVKENIEFEMKFNSSDENKIKSFKYFLETNLWAIEKEQEFDFPELTEDNTLDPNDAEQGVPFIFENILKDEE